MVRYYGQFGQDKHLMEEIYSGLKQGYFVDVGAYDGENMSNTLTLEVSYQWKGICAEPNARLFKLLKERRSCICTDLAVWNKDNATVEFWDDDVGGCSSIGDKSVLNTHASKTSVNTITLKTLLDQSNAPNFIEYMSMDTEGTEYDILAEFDASSSFDQYTFGYLTIEHNFEQPKRQKIQSLLESKGYKLFRSHHVDDEYINKSVVPKQRLL